MRASYHLAILAELADCVEDTEILIAAGLRIGVIVGWSGRAEAEEGCEKNEGFHGVGVVVVLWLGVGMSVLKAEVLYIVFGKLFVGALAGKRSRE